MLHLHRARSIDTRVSASCARVRVPRDGGFCARFVFGGAGEDLGRGGGGEQFGRACEERVASVANVWTVRATIPRRRVLRARVGMLEKTCRGAARDGFRSDQRDQPAWERFVGAEYHEDGLSVKEAELSMMRRLGDASIEHSHRADQSFKHLF